MEKELENILKNEYDNHIMPFLWLAGEDKQTLREYMLKIHESHIKSIVLESRTHPDFLGERWWDDLAYILETAKDLDMKVWILDDSHFPTGFVNGTLEKKYPDCLKTLLYFKCIDVLGPSSSIGVSTFLNDESANILGIYAKNHQEVIDLTFMKDQDIIYFDVPQGHWKVYIIYTTQKADFRKEYINMVDKQSCYTLIQEVYEPHYQRFKKYFGNTIAGFFSDEPGFMNEKGLKNDSIIGKDMYLPWSDELAEEIKKSLGKDYILQFDGLWNDNEESSLMRYTYMNLCTKLYQNNFCDQLGQWCRQRKVEYIGHIIEDRDSHARLGVGAGHFFRAMQGQDMAGLDIVLNQLIPGLDEGYHATFRGAETWDNEFFHYALGKLGSSLAYIDAKKKGRTVAEVFGAFGWQEGLKMMKWITDYFLVRGVNYFVPHAFSPKDFPDTDCPPHFYAHGHNPQFRYFKDLMLYMNKMSTLLSHGITKPEIAVLYHAEAEWTGQYMMTQKVTKILTRKQVDFDIIPCDVFSHENPYHVTFDQKLDINTQHYQCLIIPYCEYITKDLADFIIKTRNTHFQVVFIQDYPSHILNDNGQLLQQVQCNSQCLSLQQLYDYIIEHQLYTISTSENQNYLSYHHYYKDNREYIMLFNEDPKNKIHTKIHYFTDYPIYQINVLKNQIEKVKNDDGFYIDLSPYESYIYMIGEINLDIPLHQTHDYLKVKEIQGPYQLSIASNQNYPHFEYQRELFDLENMSLQKHFPDFSGTFRYTIEWDNTEEITSASIDLGDVYEIADLYINDCYIGTRFCPPYTFEINDIIKVGRNKIVIDVTNTLDKQVRDMISLGEEIKPSGLLDKISIYYK